MSGDTLAAEKPYLRLAGMIAGNLGTLPPNVVEHYIGNAKQIPDALARGFVVPEPAALAVRTRKFALLADLGILVVPADYDHATALLSFRNRNREKLSDYNKGITDKHFPNPSRILKPGDRLWVQAWRQVSAVSTSSEQLMKFLDSINSQYTGVQGLALVFDQKRDQLPKGQWYTSMDEKDRLWKNANGYRLPGLNAYSDSEFDIGCDDFEGTWDDYCVLLSFRDEALRNLGA